jgi:small conductance mechanosensitive channel
MHLPQSAIALDLSQFDDGVGQTFNWFSSNLDTLLFILIVAAGTVFLARMANHLMQSYLKNASDRLHVDMTTFRMFRHITVAAIYFLGLMIIIFSIPDLQNIATALLASAGLAGIIIGFAAQSTLSNIIAGLSLAIFQPFRVGDRVNIMNEYGKVTDLNLRHTVVTTWDNRRLIIPNSIISEESIINWTIEDPAVIWAIDIGISYDADIDLARRLMIDEARKHPEVMPPHNVEYSIVKPGLRKSDSTKPGIRNIYPVLHTVDPDFRQRGDVEVYVTELGDFAVNMRLLVWFKDRSVAYSSGCMIREAIKKRFDKEGIEIPFPYRTIVYKKDLEKEASGTGGGPGEISGENAPFRTCSHENGKTENGKDCVE